MIKKLLLAASAILVFELQSFGQAACVPDPQYTNTSTQNGIYPDSATNFDTAYVGIPYTQLVTVVIPPDTQAFPPPFPPVVWDSTVLTAVSGLPPGFTYACWNNSSKPNRCAWNGNSIGCAKVTGNPVMADTGVYPLQFNTESFLGGQTSPQTYNITYYKIVILASTAINENPRIQVLLQNSPNPFTDKTEIQFGAEGSGIADFKIYNMIGTVIYDSKVKVKKGVNRIDLDAKDFDAGIYFYSIVHGNNAFTRKMVVSNK